MSGGRIEANLIDNEAAHIFGTGLNRASSHMGKHKGAGFTTTSIIQSADADPPVLTAKAFSKSKSDVAPEGPCHPYTWRHNDAIIADLMQPAAWRLVDFLWRQPGYAATFDDLKMPVYDDAEHLADQSHFGSLGGNV